MSTDTTELMEAAEARDAALQEARRWGERYAELKAAPYLIEATGERMKGSDLEKEAKRLNTNLKAFIEAHGPIYLEGIGQLELQPKRGKTVYERPQDTLARDPDTFWRMFELGCAIWDEAAMEVARKNGHLLTTVPSTQLAGTPSLIINEAGRR